MAAMVGTSVLQPNIKGGKLIAKLSNLGLIGLLLVLAAILTAAMVLQYGYGEIPCALCLLQRVAMFGICFGLIHHLQLENGARGVGLALVSAVFLLFISGRQTLIDIYPRPGHSYVGSAVLGLHMPVWSVLIALSIISALSIQIAVVGELQLRRGDLSPKVVRIARWTGLYVIMLSVINVVSVFLQCGFDACKTDSYRLLG
ncbi:disulfide bond formation protein B [Methylobacterium sp. CM6257]